MANTYTNTSKKYEIPSIDFRSYESRLFVTEKSRTSYTTTKKDLFNLLDYKKFNDTEFILFFDHRGNDAWNEKSMTMQKGTKFEFSLACSQFIKPLIVGTCYCEPFEYSQILIDKFDRWIKEYLILKTKCSN